MANRLTASKLYPCKSSHNKIRNKHKMQVGIPLCLFPLFVLVTASLITQAVAFAAPRPPVLSKKSFLTIRRAGAQENDDPTNPMKDVTELTSTLARLDQQWSIQQKFSSKAKSRWSKLILPKDPEQDVMEEDAGGSPSSIDKEEFVWLLEPPNSSIPSCVIVFAGGAGLGQFPHIAYSELLTRISNRLNAAVLAAPYQVGLDHFALAKQTGEHLRRALIHCEDDPSRQYPPTIPTYCLAHSLGCKLQTIYMAATGQDYDGIGFMNFNNFSFRQTVSMARIFADNLRGGMDQGSSADGGKGFGGFDMRNPFQNEQALNTLFEFAETVVDAIGVDFSPNSKDTNRLIQLKYDDERQRKTRLFVCDEDNLDTSKEFVDNCSGGPGPSASGLPGGHLASVYFKLGLDDFGMDDIPEEAREMAQEAMGGFQSASFGDEEHLDMLVDEVCDWVLGRQPGRPPRWDAAARNERPPQIAAASSDK